jgi:hypothetical protein
MRLQDPKTGPFAQAYVESLEHSVTAAVFRDNGKAAGAIPADPDWD